eukprot:3368-Heterococcus_DN1.PRE.2
MKVRMRARTDTALPECAQSKPLHSDATAQRRQLLLRNAVLHTAMATTSGDNTAAALQQLLGAISSNCTSSKSEHNYPSWDSSGNKGSRPLSMMHIKV